MGYVISLYCIYNGSLNPKTNNDVNMPLVESNSRK